MMGRHDDFWTTLATGHTNTVLSGAMDQHLSGKAVGESFGSVQELTDAARAAGALPLPVEAGTKVSFAGNLGAYLTYDDTPPKGAMGEVVNVKSANGDITHHDGKVFVQWDDGKFRSIHAEHLRLASGGKTAKVRVLDKHGPVPDEMEGMAKEILAAYTKAVPMLRGYIRNITVTAYKGDTFHITVIAPGWSIHIDEERPGFDLDTADTFNKQQDKGEAAMEAVARRYGYRPSGAGKWLANKEGQKIMLGLAGGGGRAASDRQAGIYGPPDDPGSIYFKGHSKARRLMNNIVGTRNPRKREELFRAFGKLYIDELTLDEVKEYKQLEKRYRKPGWRKELPTKHASDLKADFEKIKALAEKRPDSKFLKSLLKQMADKGFAPTDKQMAVVKKIEGEAKEMATMQKELKSLKKGAIRHPFNKAVFLRDLQRAMGDGELTRQGLHLGEVVVKADSFWRSGAGEPEPFIAVSVSGSSSWNKGREYFNEDYSLGSQYQDPLSMRDIAKDIRGSQARTHLAADYDPSQIGKKKGGPVSHDPEDKNIMGHFGQGDLHEMTEIAKSANFSPRQKQQMRTFKKQNPWFNELSLIKGQRRTFVGDGRFMIKGRTVGLMAKAGLVETYESQWADSDKTVELTPKGARILRQQEENYEDFANRVASFRVASLGDLRAFLQRSGGKLVHKSTNDLWSYAKDAEGGFIVSRLFDDTGEPLKG